MKNKLKKILEEIKSGQRTNTGLIFISVREYLSKDSDGISFLEHLLKLNFPINIHHEKNLENILK